MSAVLPRRHVVRVPLLGGQAMESDSLKHVPGGTGGVLLGTWESSHLAKVEVVIGPGPNADHVEFRSDAAWQDAQISRLLTMAPSSRYLGEWHVDGGTDPVPTHKHVRRAEAVRERLGDPAARLLMLVGTTQADGNFDIAPYVLQGRKLVRARLEWSEDPVIIWF